MFKDIAEMEKEIERFRKNMFASSEVVESISTLVEETKRQKESFSASSEKLLKKTDECIAEFKREHDAVVQSINSSNDAELKELKTDLSEEQQKRINELEQIRASIENCQTEAGKKADEQIANLTENCKVLITEMKSSLNEQQTAYVQKLQQSEQAIREYQNDAEQKYQRFISRLENSNVDQLFAEIQGLKKSIQTKFIILMMGLSAAIAIGVVEILVR